VDSLPPTVSMRGQLATNRFDVRTICLRHVLIAVNPKSQTMAFGVHRFQGLGTPFFLHFIVSHSWERHFFSVLSFPTLGNAIFSLFYHFPPLGTPFFLCFIISHSWERHFFSVLSFPTLGNAIFSLFYHFPLLGTPFFSVLSFPTLGNAIFSLVRLFPNLGNGVWLPNGMGGIAVGAGLCSGPHIWNNKQAFLAKTDGFHPFALHVPVFFVTLQPKAYGRLHPPALYPLRNK